MYDLAKDRGESHDLAGQMPEKVRELERLWNTHYEETLRMAFSDDPAKKRTEFKAGAQSQSGLPDVR